VTATTTTRRCACGKPSPTTTICRACEHTLQLALITAALLATDLNTAISRQAVFGTPTGRTRGTHPLPYDINAAKAAENLQKTLLLWAKTLRTT
jgi:hypothetical protein